MKNLFSDRDAVFSPCKRYRYLLRRVWDKKLPRALVVMLNPSIADDQVDDPTIRSLFRLLRSLGYGSFEVVNVFGLISTDPGELSKHTDPIGPRNHIVIEGAIGRCDVAIFAWGAHPMAQQYAGDIQNAIRSCRPAVYCFGKTKGGEPKHPLYLKTGTQLEVYA